MRHQPRCSPRRLLLVMVAALAAAWLLRPTARLSGENAPPPIFGVSTRGELANPAVRSLVQQTGVTFLRTSVSWAGVQPSPEVYNWAAFDGEIRNVVAAGGTPVVLVAENPAWAASTRCGPVDRVDISVFANFVYALAARYNGTTQANGTLLPRIDYFEFYNEPDNQQMSEQWIGGCFGQHGAAYAQMLAAAWSAAHLANPQVKILFGPIAGEYVTYNDAPLFNFDLNGDDFVDDVLSYMQEHPTSLYFDAFNFHYFPAFHSRWDVYGNGVIGKTEYYRMRMLLKGITRPVICTETGRRSDPGQVIDGQPGSDEEQSRYVVRLFVQGLAANLQGLVWFSLSDINDGSLTAWGLLDSNRQPKPSYDAFRVLISQLGEATYLQPLAALPEGGEGYVFALPGGGRRSVVWSRDALSKLFAFPVTWLHTTDKWGQERVYRDGQPGDEDGVANGALLIRVGGSPVYADQVGGQAAAWRIHLPIIVQSRP